MMQERLQDINIPARNCGMQIASGFLRTTVDAAMKKLWIQTPIGSPGLLVGALLLTACGGSNGGGGATTVLTVGGSVTGLVSGTSVELENGGKTAIITANGSYSVTGSFISGASYDVTVAQQPAGSNCVVTNGSGTVRSANISNVLVTCTPNTYAVSGTLSGLLSGRSLVLQDNGGNSTTVSSSGSFSFSSAVPSGGNYAVTIMTQPAGQNCSVSNGSGVVGAANITNVSISCSDNTYNVAATVTGVNASGLVLQNNGADNFSVAANGTFNFNTPVASGSPYAVSIVSQAAGESCTVSNGSGTVLSSNVGSVTVNCVPNLYPISGILTGLLGGRSLILQDNGTNSTTVSANGTVNFSNLVPSGSNYSVTVFSQPVGQNCSVTTGSGTVAGSAVSNVGIACSDNTFNIGVAVSGVIRRGLTLQDNGGDNLSVASNGSFTFATPAPSGSVYAVTLLTQPAGENCSVTSGSGTVVAANVIGIPVDCTPISYTIGGAVAGLLANNSVVLEDNGGNDTSVSANGGFGFSGQIASGSAYTVTVSTQPPGQNCTVTNGSGTVVGSNISTVGVACSDNTYNIGVIVSGLSASESLVLQDNRGDNLTISANGSVNFATPVASGSGFAVTILSSPLGESCLIANGSGTVTSSNVAVTVGCTPINYTVSGAVSGLLTGNSVTLQDNGGDNTTVSANSGFSFPTSVASGSAYAVTVLTQPSGQTCSVSNGGGTIAGANITNVTVGCSDNSYNIGVTVSGLGASGLVLQDNAGDNLTISANGSVNFATPVPSGSPYAVTVLSNPTGETCTVTNGSGTVTSSNVSGIPVSCAANTYTIGGSVTGLESGSVVLEDNGGDTLTITSNGSFTFATAITTGGAYAVTIATQPTGQNCTVTNGSGTVAAANITNVSVSCAGEWTWAGGSNSTTTASPVYGSLGVASSSDNPAGRLGAATWSDGSGNLWLFGGAGNSGILGDLWKYNPMAGTWEWVGGPNTINNFGVYGTQGVASTGNMPGSRYAATSWIDSSGNFWLFGGVGYGATGGTGELNDLWEFNPAAGTWEWVSGTTAANSAGTYGTLGLPASTNAPPGREGAVSWVDGSGKFWLFGGASSSARYSDLWTFDPAAVTWEWVGGSNQGNSRGVYGTLGVASTSDEPGARDYASAWADAAGNFWLFGGVGYDSTGNPGYLNDLWKFNPTSVTWEWVSGSNTANTNGITGTLGVPSTSNTPGSRLFGKSWTDAAGNFWLFGGQGPDGIAVNDLWEFNPGAGTWEWVGGLYGVSTSTSANGVYGTLGVASASSFPGARIWDSAWTDSSGNLWLFGGMGYDSSGNYGYLNDMWEYIP
jgi:Galactose oxidase, central domain